MFVQIEELSDGQMENTAWDLEKLIHQFWHQKRIFKEVTPELWTRVVPSMQREMREDDGFVTIE